MHNSFLPYGEANEIDAIVRKVHRDLGNPKPPLSLDQVRDLLRLDRGYYSSSDTGLILETAHRLRVAGKLVLEKPSRLVDAIRKWDLKALYVPDSRRILIDADEPTPKHRWNEAHEVGHSLIPWHDAFLHGDHRITLSASCHEELERQANYAAARLLFIGDEFRDRLLASEVCFDRVRALGKEFKNTMTTTLWRAVEAMETPALGMVSCHPREADSNQPIRYFLRSRRFLNEFTNVTAAEVFAKLYGLCRGRRGPIGSGELLLDDDRGQEHVFFVECFNNSHDTLTLGLHRSARAVAVQI